MRLAERISVALAVGEPRERSGHSPLQVAYLTAALEGRRADAYGLARDALLAGTAIGRVYRELLVATQRRLGDLWEVGSISVAEEHLASAVTASVVARLYEHLPAGDGAAGRVVVTGVEGELHSLPAHFAADLLQLEGWDVSLVGPNVPRTAILSVVDEKAPDAVGLSVTMPFNIAPTVSLIQELRALRPGLRILLGGRAVRDKADLARSLGVDLMCNLGDENRAREDR